MKITNSLTVTAAALSLGALAGCGDDDPRPPAAIVVDVSDSTGDQAARELYLADLQSLVATLDSAGQVLVAPLGANPLTEAGTTIAVDLTPEGENSLVADLDADERRAELIDAIPALFQDAPSHATDVMSTVEVACDWLRDQGADELGGSLTIISDMVQTVPPIYEWTEENMTDVLENSDKPDCAGITIDVYRSGQSTQGPPADTMRQINNFWHTWLTATGATVGTYSPLGPIS